MGLISSEASIYNNMETNEVRKGGDTAIATYNEGIDKISRYEVKSKLNSGKEDINVTADILQEIQTQVAGRETMGEVSDGQSIYISEENDRDDR